MENKVNFNWSNFLVGGLIALVYGLLALLLPEGVVTTVVIVMGIGLILVGAVGLLIAFNRKKKERPWGMLLFESVVMVLLGIAAVIWSEKAVDMLFIIIGVWVAVIGLMQLITLLSLSKFVYKIFYIVCSVLAIAFGVLMILKPFDSAQFFVRLTGAIALLVGILTIMFSLAVRSLQGKVNKQLKKRASAPGKVENVEAEVVEDAEIIED